jgi:hypothetical protein
MHAIHGFERSEEMLDKYRDKHWFAKVIELCLREKMNLPKA